jgi:neutral ceramidase
VISGLANEYSDYFTTPEEYDAQHYEGAATAYGRASSDALEQVLVELATDLAGGKPAPPPYPYDPRNGVSAEAGPFSEGAHSGQIVTQPETAASRLGHPSFSWQGGPRGFDRPLDRPFVLVQRRVHRHWRMADSDLGLAMLWTVDANGVYQAEWEPPLNARRGVYRFQVHANHYSLTSGRFRLRPSTALTVNRLESAPGRIAIELRYPPAFAHEDVGDPPPDSSADLTYRPTSAAGGRVTFVVNGRRHAVRLKRSTVFSVAASPGDVVEIHAGAARDRFGNRNPAGVSFSP